MRTFGPHCRIRQRVTVSQGQLAFHLVVHSLCSGCNALVHRVRYEFGSKQSDLAMIHDRLPQHVGQQHHGPWTMARERGLRVTERFNTDISAWPSLVKYRDSTPGYSLKHVSRRAQKYISQEINTHLLTYAPLPAEPRRRHPLGSSQICEAILFLAVPP